MRRSIFAILIILLFGNVFGCTETIPAQTKTEEQIESTLKDTVPPLIILNAEREMTIEVGSEVDLTSGLIGLDNIDNNITPSIVIDDGGFTNTIIGKYTIKYYLQDRDGNEADSIMRTITVIDSKNAKLVAHRGGKGAGLENTKEAFINAIEKGYYGVECDIQPTKDNQLILWHDLTFKNYGYYERYIKDMNFDEIKDYVLSKKETDGFTYTGKILLFSEFLQIIKNSHTKAFIELKESNSRDTVDLMLKEIDESGIEWDQIVIIANSASIDLLVYLRSLYSNVKLQFVARTDYQNYMQTCIENKIDLDISSSCFDDNLVLANGYLQLFHDNGLEVNIWVINKSNDLKKYLVMGANYITTDSLIPGEVD